MKLYCILASCAMTLLTSCAPKASPDGCAGWEPLQAAEATVERLAVDDPQTLRQMIAHNETGQQRGCWK